MLRVDETLKRMFDAPRLFFTVRGNTRSESVVSLIQRRVTDQSFLDTFNCTAPTQQECLVLDDEAAVRKLFEGGVSPSSAVVLFDVSNTKRFSPTSHSRPNHGIPSWACGAQWGIKVGTRCESEHHGQQDCAQQVAANFGRNFRDRLAQGWFPWGNPRKGENPPVNVTMPDHTGQMIASLNQGPNLAGAIADKECALELPQGSRISWYRVPPDPLRCDMEVLTEILQAFEAFEGACSSLVRQNSEVHADLLAGVDVDDRLREIYLHPIFDCFSVRRPDLHFTGDGLFSSENDEMPGGFAECVHLDRVYGVNQSRWRQCFDWLTAHGPLLFLVSHQWSECYIPEMRWLTEHLRHLGYEAMMLTTDDMDGLKIRPDGVYVNDCRIGTIWRQFPIFEARGKLVDVVQAAQRGLVWMSPEFAHFGNKVWYSLFRKHNNWFRQFLDERTFQILDAVLPDSHLVQSAQDFPCTVSGMFIPSLEELRVLSQQARDMLVLKIAGANNLAARSYGVLMGHGLNLQTWQQWIDERMHLKQPFIIQRRLETGVVQMPVFNTKRQCGEVFNCRVLLRPWVVNQLPVSVSTCAVPSNTLRVHGRVDMAMAPVALE